MSFNWKALVKTVAPVLGTAIGGPFGGMATKAISDVLLGPEEKTEGAALEAKIATAIQGDPDALLKLKAADQDFDKRMKELDVDIMQIDADDRASARAMAKESGLKPQIIIAGLYNLGFIAIIYAVFFSVMNLTGVQKDIALYLLGILSAGLIQINNFFFGSSSGSKEKTAKMGMK